MPQRGVGAPDRLRLGTRRSGARGCVRLVACALVALCVLAGAPQALGHAELIRTTPTDGQALDRPPGRVILTFNEHVSAAPGALRVLDSSGADVPNGEIQASDGNSIAVRLPERLAEGAYTVSWRVVSADQHPIGGAFVFTVGTPTGAAAVPVAVSNEPPGWVGPPFDVVRVMDLALILVVAGGLLVAPLALGAVSPGVHRRLERWLGLAALGMIPVAVAAIVLQSAQTAGAGLPDALGRTELAAVLDTAFGTAWLLRIGVGGALAVLLLGSRGRDALGRRAPASASAIASVLVIAPGLAGHARAEGPVDVAIDALHVGGAAIWTGGLALVVAALLLTRPGRWALAASAVPRFSALALGSVAVLVAAGSWATYRHIGSWAGFVDSRWGILVLAKICLVGVLLVLGGYNNRVSVPRLRAGDPGRPARRRFLAVCAAELALMAGAVGITGVLVGSAPPADAAATAPTPAIGPDDSRADLGPYRLRLVVTPATTGSNYIDLYLRDGSGEPARPAEVTAEASLPEAAVAPIALAIEPREPGHFIAQAAVLPIPGDWDLRVSARRGEFEQFTTTVTVTIRKDTP